MKTISQREFQNAYVSPTEEQTARLQAKLDRLTKSPEEKPAERRSKPLLAFVLAAALLLIGTFTAVAATLKYYAVSWDGKVKDYQPSEEFREPYEYPDEITVPLDRAIHEGYFAKVVFDGEEHGFDPETTIESEEEAIALLDAEGYPHPTPLIPEGYQFAQCYIQYGSFDGLRHIENAIYSGKYTLYIYSVAPEMWASSHIMLYVKIRTIRTSHVRSFQIWATGKSTIIPLFSKQMISMTYRISQSRGWIKQSPFAHQKRTVCICSAILQIYPASKQLPANMPPSWIGTNIS